MQNWHEPVVLRNKPLHMQRLAGGLQQDFRQGWVGMNMGKAKRAHQLYMAPVSMAETDRISAQKPPHQYSKPGRDLIYRVHPGNKARFRNLKICARQQIFSPNQLLIRILADTF